ncbi:MAG: protein kinase [Thermaerobacter sp.]|nr:protein kinase [Thermaerobacter sp.]
MTGREMVGRVLAGRYDLLDRIGQGGMAVVYRARDLALNRLVAVKVLREHLAEDPTLVERFQLEARSAASLDNRHVVQVFDVGTDLESHYIVMELVDGENLKDYLTRAGPLAVDEALGIVDQVAEALSEAHAQHIIHRDIKPQNILLADDGTVKVTDFGIAQAISAGTLVNSGSMLGTAQYVSPEQARGRSVGPTSDLYGLGVLLYELLAGHPPFSGESPIAVALRHVQDAPPDVRSERPDVPPGVAALLTRLLAKDAEERYQSAEAFRRQLEAVRRGDPEPETSEAGPPVQRRPKKRRTWLYVLGIILLGLAGLIYAFVRWLAGPAPVTLSNLRNDTVAAAEARLRAEGFQWQLLGHRSSTHIAKGRVLSEAPAAGTVLRPGQTVGLLVSSGPSPVVVPPLVGDDQQQAVQALTQAGLKSHTRTVTNAAPAGQVVGQSPAAGRSVSQGSVVTLTVSNGHGGAAANQVVPILSGMTTTGASSALASVGMTLGSVSYTYSTEPANTVVTQSPAPESAAQSGAPVNVTLSKGPSPGSATALANTSTVGFTIPTSAPSHSLVEAQVTDSTGNEEVYYQAVTPGQNVSFTVAWYGQSGQLVLYLNGSVQGQPTVLTPQANPGQNPPGGSNNGT